MGFACDNNLPSRTYRATFPTRPEPGVSRGTSHVVDSSELRLQSLNLVLAHPGKRADN